MISPVRIRLRDEQRWLRVADAGWHNPLDPSFAQRRGGRWNPPSSYPTLYLNQDIETARSQIRHMLEGSPVRPEDLDPPYDLVVVTLPAHQVAADAVTDVGLKALGLPSTYPLDEIGALVPREACQPVGGAVKDEGLRGIHARSATTTDGSGRELAWFPARPSSKARPVGDPIPFDRWWY